MWANPAFGEDVRFALLEQFVPDGPEHPFASTMLKHYKQLQTPLHSTNVYPTLAHHEQRFKIWGWSHAQARSLWDLWSDEDFLSSSLRKSLDTVEAFDEWEEFALSASHYFLLTASTIPPSPPPKREQGQALDPQLDATSRFMMLPQCAPGSGQRRYGALVPDSKISLGHHGGLGRRTRLASTSLYTKSNELAEPELSFPPEDIPPRMCHTVTALSNGDCLLVGGRASPTNVLQDCWLRKDNAWRQTHNIPIARYRHSAVKVTVGNNIECVLVHGGRIRNGECLDSWDLWSDKADGWQTIDVNGPKPRARFGACLGNLNSTSGVMFGGIGPDGTILEDFWAWELLQRKDGSISLDLTDQTENLKSVSPLFKYINRFGATINRTFWGLVITGGIIPRKTVPFDREIILLDSTKLLNRLTNTKPWSPDLLSSIGLGLGFKGPRPLLTGHVACVVEPDQLLILGGGAVCFPFGTCWTEGTWLLKQPDENVENAWTIVSEIMRPDNRGPKLTSQVPCQRYAKAGDIAPIPRVAVQSAAQFQQILANGRPVVIEGSNIGSCTELWTKEYLTDTVGSDRMVRKFNESRETGALTIRSGRGA